MQKDISDRSLYFDFNKHPLIYFKPQNSAWNETNPLFGLESLNINPAPARSVGAQPLKSVHHPMKTINHTTLLSLLSSSDLAASADP